jgi:hypothetical protein
MVRNFRQWMPGHQPIWTCVGVPRLGEDDMRVEIEVVAHDPEGAQAQQWRAREKGKMNKGKKIGKGKGTKKSSA